MLRQWLRLHIHLYNRMKHFFIIANGLKDSKLTVTKQLVAYIEKKGGTVAYGVSVDEAGSHAISPSQLPPDTECILVIGGDGTLIRAARDMVGTDIPLLGVNLGKLGYLCELEEDTLTAAIDELFLDHFTVENRMMLSGYAVIQGEKTEEHLAFNDIVIHRTGPLQIVNLDVSVNGEYLCAFKADGAILASPTGSTGYNMSAGGPIVDPKAEMLLMTPINCHTLNSRSIVIGAEDEVCIELGTRRIEKDEIVEVSFDGDHAMQLSVNDQIVIHKAQVSTKILKISKISFLEILRRKMNSYS